MNKGSMMRKFANLLIVGLAILMLMGPAQSASKGRSVTITGELIDSWCYVTEIMYALGTAHHQRAIWCAVGGIPVSVRDDQDNLYVVLKIEADDTSVANQRLITIQGHKVTVKGDLYRRDGVNYIFVTQVADDQGIINLTHKIYGVQPGG